MPKWTPYLTPNRLRSHGSRLKLIAFVLTVIEPRSQEATLVRAAQSGDRAAFGTLYEQYERLVHGILLSHVSYYDAEDLVQDVFLKAMERLPALREPAAFCGWLIAIARRTATDHLRSKRITSEPRASLPGRTQPDGEAFAVLAVIQRLPESYRGTLILRLVEGMTGPEIAARTGLTPDSVRVNLCRGMKLLRAHLERKEGL
ncbi:MAG: sigma-70 family RNA polymerase sigma factor [Acidobacteriaceae bacterium]|nr:sigma-70 family RNA polymerase sigma factor [Acidobacteriaceae bacterium]